MLYRTIPKNGDQISALGFGTLRLPMNPDRSMKRDIATAQIRYAIDKGINYIDTAWTYGESEEMLGDALKDGYRAKVKLATKMPSWLVKNRADMYDFLYKQLEKLQTQYIDYYMLHGLNGDLWRNLDKLDICGFFEDIKAKGLAKNIGFSFHGTNADFHKIIDGYDWDMCQIQYNILDENHQAGKEGLQYAASKGIGVIIMEPLRGGRLVNPIPDEIKELWNESPIERTPAEWALKWVWNHPEVTCVLSGMNSFAQIDENIKIASETAPNSLSVGENKLIAKVAKKYNEIMKIGCTGCGYCQPCPRNVDIPDIFETFNHYHMFKDYDEIKFGYTVRRLGAMNNNPYSFASQCIECGQCENICPQHLNIIELLKETQKDLENEELPDRISLIKMIFGLQ